MQINIFYCILFKLINNNFNNEPDTTPTWFQIRKFHTYQSKTITTGYYLKSDRKVRGY